MVTTVMSAMTAFLGAIQPTSNQVSEASVSHTALRAYLRNQLRVFSDFLTGSYSRDTMLRQSRDVDLFLVLDRSYFDGTRMTPGYKNQATGPANLLDRVMCLLQAKYQNTSISHDGQAVRIELSHVHIDVVPAFPDSPRGYLIPDSPTNSWIRSDPAKHWEAVNETNRRVEVGGRLIPLVKIIKYWNHDHSYGINGFFLEMWAYDMFRHWSLPSYTVGAYTFFKHGPVYIDNAYTVPDPASSVDLMQSYLGGDSCRSEARDRFVAACDLAAKAINANNTGDTRAAVDSWKRLFGTSFPTYG